MRVGLGVIVALLAASVGSAEAQRPAPPSPPAPPAPPTRPGPPPGYQGGGAERSERFSRKVRIGRTGRFTINNIAGDIIVTAASGDEVSVDAVKRTRGDERELAGVTIEVEGGDGRVDVRTTYPTGRNRGRFSFSGNATFRRNEWVRVDYTIAVPASIEVDAKSVSGNVRVTGVQGAVRAETVGGNVTTSGTPRLEVARSISGTVDISDIASDRTVAASTVSGSLRGRSVKARSLELRTVSGDVALTDAACDRVEARSTSGSIDYAGALLKGGSYDFNVHSGTIRLALPDSPGFHLEADTFSGSIRSDLPLTIGGDADRGRGRGWRGVNGRSIQATFGDGSATVTLRSFSGSIVIVRR